MSRDTHEAVDVQLAALPPRSKSSWLVRGAALFLLVLFAPTMLYVSLVDYTRSNPDPDPRDVYRRLTIIAAVSAAPLLGYALIRQRRQRLNDDHLYARLAVEPIGARVVDPLRWGRIVGLVQVAGFLVVFGASGVVTWRATGTGVDAAAGTSASMGAIGAYLVVMVLTMVVASFATRAARRWLAPLGLTSSSSLRDMRGRGSAAVYSGRRHGRAVDITTGSGMATTTVNGSFSDLTPITVGECAALTGLDADGWKGVSVRLAPDAVTVTRIGREVTRWFYRDLFLAEQLANRSR